MQTRTGTNAVESAKCECAGLWLDFQCKLVSSGTSSALSGFELGRLSAVPSDNYDQIHCRKFCWRQEAPRMEPSSSSSAHRTWADTFLWSDVWFSPLVLPRTLLLMLLLFCGSVGLNPAYQSAFVNATNLAVGPIFNLLENSFVTSIPEEVYDLRHIIVPDAGGKGYACAWGYISFNGLSTDNPIAKWGQIWEFDLNVRTVSVLCGSKVKGQSVDGNATTAAFFGPTAVALSANKSELYVVEFCTDMIRAVNLTSPEKNTRPLVKFTGTPNSIKAAFYMPGSRLNASSLPRKCANKILDASSTMVYDEVKDTLYVATLMSIIEVDLRNLKISVRYPFVAPTGESIGFGLSTDGSSLAVPYIDNSTVLRLGLDRKHEEVLLGGNASSLAGAVPYKTYYAIPRMATYLPDDHFLVVGVDIYMDNTGFTEHFVQLVEFDLPNGKVIKAENTNVRFKDPDRSVVGRSLAVANYGTDTLSLLVATQGQTAELWMAEIDPDVVESPSLSPPSSSSSPMPSAPRSDNLLPISSVSAVPSSAVLPPISWQAEPSLNASVPESSIGAVPLSATMSSISSQAEPSLNTSAESLSSPSVPMLQMPDDSFSGAPVQTRPPSPPSASASSAASAPSWSCALAIEVVVGLVLCWAGIFDFANLS